MSSAQIGMLDYGSKLSATPSAIQKLDIQKLHDFGFDDRSIHDICMITAYYNFVNRIAGGLGVTLESNPE